jgi:diguanylate cyclase (GGDEF)-like protein
MQANRVNSPKENILIVEEENNGMTILSSLLTQSGYQVRQVVDTQMALRTAQISQPDLILLEIKEPQSEGYEVCKRLKSEAKTQQIPVIFLGSVNEVFDRVTALALGATDYITKPCHWQEILIRVENHLNSLRQQKELLAENAKLQQELEHCLMAEASLERSNEELMLLATLDSLTQVANRRRFDEYIYQEWRRLIRYKEPISLILCDVDFFKDFNDRYGHQSGDNCLQQIAQAIRRVIKRPADLVARYGGEEFAVILPNTNIQGAVYVAEMIQLEIQLLKIPHAFSQISSYITLSLGVATMIPSLDMNPGGLIAVADLALYEAKHQGRDRIVAHNS